MVVLLIRMKLVVLRHGMTGRRATDLISGGVFGLALAAGTVLVAVWRFPVESIPYDLLGAALAVWTFGWLLGPVLFGGGDETLRPEHFALLPFRPRALAAGLLGASFVGVAPVVTAVAFAAIPVIGARTGALTLAVGVVAAVLQLLFAVLASKFVTAAFGQVMRSKAGAALAALVSAAILAAFNSGWVLVPMARASLVTGFSGTFSTWVHALPSGWGLTAVEAAGRGDWALAAGALAGLAVLAALSLAGWTVLLHRRLTRRRASGRPAAGAGGSGWATGPVTAVAAKELRTWSRDLPRFHYLCFALCYALVFCTLPLAIGYPGFLPWAGLVYAVWAAAMSANLYGEDGTALWGTLMVPGGARADVRGRQLAWLLVAAPPAVALSVAFTLASGQHDAWLWLAALVPAVLGGGAGVTVLISVLRPVPMTDPHRRGGNLLENGTDFAQVLLVLVLVAATAAPAFLAVRNGPGWLGPVAGVVTGVLLAWLLGAIAVHRLAGGGAALLHRMRSGPAERPKAGPSFDWDSLDVRIDLGGRRLGLDRAPAARRAAIVALLTACWVPLVAQGMVPALMILTDGVNPSWFLAFHVPESLRWPAVFTMMGAGLVILGIGLHLLLRTWQEARPRRLEASAEP